MNDNQEINDNWLNLFTDFSAVEVDSLGVVGFLFVLGMSLFASFYIAVLYHKFYQSRATGSQAHRAFPLLGLSVTAIFICIQFSLSSVVGTTWGALDRPLQNSHQGAGGSWVYHVSHRLVQLRMARAE